MSLESVNLLPELQLLPVDESTVGLVHQGIMCRLTKMDRDQFSIEFAEGVEESVIGLFNWINISDGTLAQMVEARRLSFPNSTQSLHEHYSQLQELGPNAARGFINNLKGKLGELRAKEWLEDQFPDHIFSLASSPVQPGWDIMGTAPDGTEHLYQVKVGLASQANLVMHDMDNAPENLQYLLSTELYQKISPTIAPVNPVLNLGISSLELGDEVKQTIERLARNFGIDLPDSLGELLPYIGEVVLGIRLIMDVISVKRDFKDIEISDRSRIQGLKALTLMSRFGIATVCTLAGSKAGTLANPGIGTAVGALGGAGLAMYLNRRLRPRMLEVAMKIAGVDDDDLYYLRNKTAVDALGQSLASTVAA